MVASTEQARDTLNTTYAGETKKTKGSWLSRLIKWLIHNVWRMLEFCGNASVP